MPVGIPGSTGGRVVPVNDGEYKRPVGGEELSSPVDLEHERCRMFWRQYIYRGKVTDFAITVEAQDDDCWRTIYRVDCAHGCVHEHRMFRNGSEKKRTLGVIPLRGWDYVDDQWSVCLDLVLDNWEQHLRRWDES